MAKLPSIPTPPARRWREFRLQSLPFVTCFAAVIAIGVLWRESVAPVRLVGQVEPSTNTVSSPKPGVLAQMSITRLQRVKAGDPVVQVITTDPKVLESSLAVIRAEIELQRLNLQPVFGEQRYALNYDRIRLDWLKERADLATARVRLQLADSEFRRADELFRDKILSEKVFEQARSNREALFVEVEALDRLVKEHETTLNALRLRGEDSPGSQPTRESVMRASLAVQEQRLRQTEVELSPIVLKAEMDGTVSAIYRHAGEAVTVGQPIVTITALDSDRIIAYLPSSVKINAKPGMTVEVSSRSVRRQIGVGRVIEVGTQMEIIPASLLPLTGNLPPQWALPIAVSRPHEIKALPGEPVFLSFDLRHFPRSATAD
jgi:multidrug resistance efflux pump